MWRVQEHYVGPCGDTKGSISPLGRSLRCPKVLSWCYLRAMWRLQEPYVKPCIGTKSSISAFGGPFRCPKVLSWSYLRVMWRLQGPYAQAYRGPKLWSLSLTEGGLNGGGTVGAPRYYLGAI